MKEINNSHRLRAMLLEQCKSTQSTQSLKMPVATRWGSSITCLESFLANKKSLRRLAIDEEAKPLLSSSSKVSILNEVFWDEISNLLELLRPFLKWITILEGDSPSMAVVAEVFCDLQQIFTRTVPNSPLTKKEEKKVFEIFENRKTFCLKIIHKAANLLDPRYKGRSLSEEEVIEASEFICNFSNRYDILEKDILADLSNFRGKDGLWKQEFLWKTAKEVSPVLWWKSWCSSRPLSKVAFDILNLPSTSAACERSFSTYGNIHTARRNRLGNTTAMKLVFIAQNLKFCQSADTEVCTEEGTEDVDMNAFEEREEGDSSYDSDDTECPAIMTDN